MLACLARCVGSALAQAAAPGGADCGSVLAKMKTDFAKEPDRLILAVEDAITTNEACACRIVRTAIDFAAHDPALTSQIVIAAIRMTPSAAAEITECALAEAPETAATIHAALSKELGPTAPRLLNSTAGKPPVEPITADPAEIEPSEPSLAVNSAGGKSPLGKAPVSAAPLPTPESETTPESEFSDAFGEADMPAIGKTGVFFFSPKARANRETINSQSVKFNTLRQISTTRQRPPLRPVAPVTSSSPK
jgi:hypothetical protein